MNKMKFNKYLEIKRIFLPSEWWLDEKDFGEVSGFFSLKNKWIITSI